MPYSSDAQRRFFNANRAKLESQGVDVDEWNESSRGKKLPERKATREKEAALAALSRVASLPEGTAQSAAGGKQIGPFFSPNAPYPGISDLSPKRASVTAALLICDAVKQARCWKGYEPVPGKAPYSEDSCRPVGSAPKAKKKEKQASPAPAERERYWAMRLAKLQARTTAADEIDN